MRTLHFIFVFLPFRILLDISSYVADYLENRWYQHKGWWDGDNDGVGRV